MNTLIKLLNGWPVRLQAFNQEFNTVAQVEPYATGDALAISLINDDGLFARLTYNDPSIPLAVDECLVKTWSENAEWFESALAQLGLEKVSELPAGHATGWICRLAPRLILWPDRPPEPYPPAGGLEPLRALTGIKWFESIRIPHRGRVMLADEEGRIRGLAPNWRASLIAEQPIVGPAVLALPSELR